MKAPYLLFLSLIAGVAAAPSPCHAMSVTPIQLEMSSAGPASRRTVVVTNDSNRPLPVELSLQRIAEGENGGRRYMPGGEDAFLILPPQALIRPGASQVFRLQWVGEPMLVESESFMLFVSQVPVKLPAGSGPAVQVVMSVGCMVNVAPPRGLPSLRITATGIEIDRHGRRHPSVTVENTTRMHALLPQSTILLTAGGWSKELTPGELGASVGIGLVQPGMRRTFVLPVDLPAGVSAVGASIDFKPTRP